MNKIVRVPASSPASVKTVANYPVRLMPYIQLRPVSLTTETHRYAQLRRNRKENSEPEELLQKEEASVISIRFYLDSELWANPQIIKPARRYVITGLMKINQWPNGYDQLQ